MSSLMSSVGSYLPTEAPAAIVFSMGLPKSIGTILIDAFIDEDHHSVVTVTTSPVEDGSTISDNAIEEPDELIINGVVGAASILNPVHRSDRLSPEAEVFRPSSRGRWTSTRHSTS